MLSHPPTTKQTRLQFCLIIFLSSLSLYRQNSDYCRKKVMIHDQKRNRGDEKDKARQRWKQNEIICWDYGMRPPSFLGMAQTWQAGWSVVQSILWGRWRLLFLPYGSVLFVQINIALSLQPDQLSSKCVSRAEFQQGNSFWCFTYVQVTHVETSSNAHTSHASESRRCGEYSGIICETELILL